MRMWRASLALALAAVPLGVVDSASSVALTMDVPLNLTLSASECMVAAVNFSSPKNGQFHAFEINLWELSAPNQGSNLKYVALGSAWFNDIPLLNDPSSFDKCDTRFDSDTCWDSYKQIGAAGFKDTQGCKYLTPMAIDLGSYGSTLAKGKKVEAQWMTADASECRTRNGLYYLYLRNGGAGTSKVSLLVKSFEGSEESCWLMRNAWVMITSTTAFFLLCCLCCCVSLRRIRMDQREQRDGPGGLGRQAPFPALARGEARDAGETEMVAFGGYGVPDDDNDGRDAGAATAATASSNVGGGGGGVFSSILRRPSGDSSERGGRMGFRSLNLNRGLSGAMSSSDPQGGGAGGAAIPAVAIAVPASMAHSAAGSIPTAAAVAVPNGGVAEAVIQSEGDVEDPATPGTADEAEIAPTTSVLAVSSPRAAEAVPVRL